MRERRNSQKRCPAPRMNLDQQSVFNNLAQFGWDLFFVRNRGRSDQMIMLRHEVSGKTALLQEGSWLENHGIAIRP